MVSDKVFHILCTAIIGNLKYFLFLKLLDTVMMVNICKEYIKDILQEFGSSICAFFAKYIHLNDLRNLDNTILC